MVVELRERFHVREKELNKRENTLMAREDDVVAAERALGRTRMECDAERDWVKAVRHDYWAWFWTSTISQQCSLDFDWVLCGCQFTLSVWDMDLERREEKLVVDQAWGLYSFDGRDLSTELEKLCEHMAEVEDKYTAAAVQLSRSVMEISDALVDLGMFPIRDIPSKPRSTQDVLMVVRLVLEQLWEEDASVASSQV
jgi:hypothetical protein